MVSIHILVIALAFTTSDATGTMKGGGIRCPCVTLAEMAVCSHKCDTYGAGGDCVWSTFNTTTSKPGRGVEYPANYGGTCQGYAEPGYADCYNLTTGVALPLAEQKQWCKDPWCFVSPCTCNATVASDMQGTWAGAFTEQNGEFTLGQDKTNNNTGMVWVFYSYKNCDLTTVDTWVDEHKVVAVGDDGLPAGQKATWEAQYGTCGSDKSNPSFEPETNAANRAKCSSALAVSSNAAASTIGAIALGFILASSSVHADVLASV